MCEKCVEKRKPIPEKSGIEILMNAVEKKDDTKNDY